MQDGFWVDQTRLTFKHYTMFWSCGFFDQRSNGKWVIIGMEVFRYYMDIHYNNHIRWMCTHMNCEGIGTAYTDQDLACNDTLPTQYLIGNHDVNTIDSRAIKVGQITHFTIV